MKTLLPLAALLTIVACEGGGGGSKSASSSSHSALVAKYAENFKLSVGMTSESKVIGQIPVATKQGALEILRTEVSKNKRETIIKIEDGAIYKFVREEDLMTGKTDLEVMKMPWAIAEASRMLDSGEAILEGDILKSTFKDIQYSDEDEVRTEGDYQVVFRINMRNPYCDTRIDVTYNKFTAIKNGVEKSLDNLGTGEQSTCITPLSTSAIKALPLSNIRFCDHTTEGEDTNCETNKDMSWLVQDL